MRNDSRFAAMFECKILNFSLIIANGDHSTLNIQHSKQKNMKKKYQHPVTRELLITGAVSLLAGSNFVEGKVENGGGIDPDIHVETGLSREDDFELDIADEEYDY
jgi:hypothetical protein